MVKILYFLSIDWILKQYSEDGTKAGRLYKVFVEEGLRSKENPFDALKAGLILGSEDFISVVKKEPKRHREIPETRKLVRNITYEEVISIVCKRLGVSKQEIKEAGRRNNSARQICLYLLRRFTDMRNEEIAVHLE